MNAEQVFSVCNLAALAGWLILIFSPRRHWGSRIVAGQAIPLLLSAVYLTLIATHLGGSKGNFSSLAGVNELFADHWLLLAGWIHYLAFDLFTGGWEMRDSELRNIPIWMMLPCLCLTFLFGPVGLLSYFLVRSLFSKPHTAVGMAIQP